MVSRFYRKKQPHFVAVYTGDKPNTVGKVLFSWEIWTADEPPVSQVEVFLRQGLIE